MTNPNSASWQSILMLEMDDPIQRSRLGSQAGFLSPLTRSNSQAADDDLSYHETGLSPEDVPTTERPPIAALGDVSLNISGISEDEEYGLEGVKPSFYQVDARRRRAKIPDEVFVLGNAADANGTIATPISKPDKTSRWKYGRKRNRSDIAISGERSTLRHVNLHWQKGTLGDHEQTSLQARLIDQHSAMGNEVQRYVSWQHCESKSLMLERFKALVSEAKKQGLQESEVRLTHRLLRGASRKAESTFVGGSFLDPLALRYDSADNSKYNVGKCSIFLAFPYFAVAKRGSSQLYEKADPHHPIRSLLQSCYRLNDTSERDKIQCIRMLSQKALRSCLRAGEEDFAQFSYKGGDELIYVPQLWALTLGLDRLITYGSASDACLQGKHFKVDDQQSTGDKKRCSLVRIQFKNQGRLEHLTYPIEQCASWFGLVNKHQQIRGILKKERDRAESREYSLTVCDRKIEARTWASVQRSCRDEVLTIWMKTPKARKASNPNIPRVALPPTVESTDPSDVEEERRPDNDEESEQDGEVKTAQHCPSVVFKRMATVPVVKPFLEWRLVDESGESEELSSGERLNRFLNAIYRSLCATLRDGPAMVSATDAAPVPESRDSIASRPKVLINGKTISDVQGVVDRIVANKPEEQNQLAKALFADFKQLLGYFLPLSHKPQSPPIRLFWGAVNDILSRSSPSYLKDLFNKTRELNAWAERVHLGVHYKRKVPQEATASGGEENREDAISPDAILMSSMVDALGATFNLVVEAARDVRRSSQPSECSRKADKAFGDTKRLLEKARDELISEASGIATDEHIGPVLTPEAILIMTMERLVEGVFGNGNADVVNVYEECLEHLALKVRDRYSRRLLQTLNAFEEELSGVHTVLLQQMRVLTRFRQYLDPESFTSPTTARKIRFEFEVKGINRILIRIREQLKNCKELQERAKTLSTQNVQLVETLQDDNGRAIFIFTFITVLFLPLSFVAGFFGMNLKGVEDTEYNVSHFWQIAMPLTGGIVLLCAAVIIWGERIWFGVATLPRKCGDMCRKRMA